MSAHHRISPQVQPLLDEYWSSRASAYHRNQMQAPRAPLDREIWRRYLEAVVPSTPQRILDVGTGTGYVAHLLSELGHEVIGIDSSPGMVDLGQKEASRRQRAGLPAATITTGDAVAPSADLGSFDVVTSRFVLWTLTDPRAGLTAWMRLVGEGGLIVGADGVWYPEAINPATEVISTNGADAFTRTYNDEVVSALPLSTGSSQENYVQLFHTAGCTDITVTPIPELRELDERFGLAPGHESTEQFLITARVQ